MAEIEYDEIKPKVTEEELSDWLRGEVQKTLDNNQERLTDCSYCDGKSPLDDQYAKLLGQNISRFDIPKVNTIRRNVDWTIGYLSGLEMRPSVMPIMHYKSDDMKMREISEYRKWQMRSMWEAQKSQRAMDRIVRDAVTSGEGIGRVEVKNVGPKKKIVRLVRRNWLGVWYDTLVDDDTMQDCRYVFDLKWTPTYVVAGENPISLDELDEFAKPQDLERPIYEQFYYSEYDAEGTSRQRVCPYGQVWWREYRDKQWFTFYAPMVADRSLTRIKLLKPGKTMYEHNRIPYVRIVADRYTTNGLPYSPLTRLKRGQEKFMQYPLRTIIELTQRRSAIITMDAVPDDQDGKPLYGPDELKQKVNAHLSGAGQVLVLKDVDAIKKDENEDMIDKQIRLFDMLNQTAEMTGIPIDPSLLGKSTNINAAVALKEKERFAHLGLNRLSNNYRDCIEDVGQLMLGCLEEFEGEIDFPNYMLEDGSEELVPDAPGPIEKNQFVYKIMAKNDKTELKEEKMHLIMEAVKTAPDNMKLSMLFAANEVSSFGSHAVMQDMVRMMAKNGVPVPDSMLPVKLAKEIAQQQEAQQQEAQRMKQIEERGILAEISAKEAEAMSKIAMAQKTEVDAEKVVAELQKTAAEQQKVLMEVPKLLAETLKIQAEIKKIAEEIRVSKEEPESKEKK